VTRAAAFAAVALALAEAAPALGQQADEAGPHQHANEDFFGWGTGLLLVLAVGVTMAWAVWRARTRPSTLPRFDDETFEREVVESRSPVLDHYERAWNVANRAALAQTELLAWQNRGNVVVGILDIDACPRTMERFPDLQPPAYVLFYRGRKLFHRPGLRQANDLQEDIDVALSREGF
jgi:hypothetical protein